MRVGGIAGLATCTLYILVSYLLPTNLTNLPVKGIMSRDEYFFEVYNNKKGGYFLYMR